MPTKRHRLHHIIEDLQNKMYVSASPSTARTFDQPKCHHFHLNFLKRLSDGGLSEVHREVLVCNQAEREYLTQRSAVIAQRLLGAYMRGGGSAELSPEELKKLLTNLFGFEIKNPDPSADARQGNVLGKA